MQKYVPEAMNICLVVMLLVCACLCKHVAVGRLRIETPFGTANKFSIILMHNNTVTESIGQVFMTLMPVIFHHGVACDTMSTHARQFNLRCNGMLAAEWVCVWVCALCMTVSDIISSIFRSFDAVDTHKERPINSMLWTYIAGCYESQRIKKIIPCNAFFEYIFWFGPTIQYLHDLVFFMHTKIAWSLLD